MSRARLAVRARRNDWETGGSRSFEESAEQKLREILAREPQHYLDANQRTELERIERSATGN